MAGGLLRSTSSGLSVLVCSNFSWLIWPRERRCNTTRRRNAHETNTSAYTTMHNYTPTHRHCERLSAQHTVSANTMDIPSLMHTHKETVVNAKRTGRTDGWSGLAEQYDWSNWQTWVVERAAPRGVCVPCPILDLSGLSESDWPDSCSRSEGGPASERGTGKQGKLLVRISQLTVQYLFQRLHQNETSFAPNTVGNCKDLSWIAGSWSCHLQ